MRGGRVSLSHVWWKVTLKNFPISLYDHFKAFGGKLNFALMKIFFSCSLYLYFEMINAGVFSRKFLENELLNLIRVRLLIISFDCHLTIDDDDENQTRLETIALIRQVSTFINCCANFSLAQRKSYKDKKNCDYF